MNSKVSPSIATLQAPLIKVGDNNFAIKKLKKTFPASKQQNSDTKIYSGASVVESLLQTLFCSNRSTIKVEKHLFEEHNTSGNIDFILMYNMKKAQKT